MLEHLLVGIGLAVLLLGISTPLWALVGLVRTALRGWREEPTATGFAVDAAAVVDRSRVAVLIAAHDEETVLGGTLRSACRQVPAVQVFVASDGSTDGTADVARGFGANVVEISPNRGKAGALAFAIQHFALVDRFEVVLLLDADTELSDDYLDTGLPLFAEDDVVAVAGTAATNHEPGPERLSGRVLVAYRERVYAVLQYLQKFGQAARGADAVAIVPGFASMYRTRILDSIEITAPGLTIEDFNMTFEVHAKRLGRIAFRAGSAVAYTQDPDTLRDYRRQVGRWSLGFWQTVRRHRWRRDRFWVALGLSIVELVAGSVTAVLAVPALAVSALATAAATWGLDPSGAAADVAAALPVPVLLLGVAVPDAALTVVGALVTRRPVLLVYGTVFPLLRMVDGAICLRQLVVALRARSDGVWTSPGRRPVVVDADLRAGSALR